jgi:DNA-binding response OmpR family regulator
MNETKIKTKVLVVDDDPNLNTVLVDKLNASGFEAIGASNGPLGIEKAFSFHPDIILLDLIMPGMDGFEVLKRIRSDEWGNKVKIIMLTLIDKIDSIAQAVENNVSGYLVKTNYSLDGIVKEINSILNKSQSKI